MVGFSVLEKDTELYRVSWGRSPGVAHVCNICGFKHIKAMPLYRNATEYEIDFCDVLKFLESRTLPRTRDGIADILRKQYKLREYSPLAMVRKDHGVSMTDFIWVRFFGEGLHYGDVRVR